MIKEQACPCNSGQNFAECCQPFLSGDQNAYTAEQLMRSRYTAFTLKNGNYILQSWHPASRPQKLDFDSYPVSWLGLEVHQCEKGKENDTTGTVEFTASYIENGQLCRLTEKSIFEKENDVWLYRRGECEVVKRKIERNKPCPCNSGKKFKRCCLNMD